MTRTSVVCAWALAAAGCGVAGVKDDGVPVVDTDAPVVDSDDTDVVELPDTDADTDTVGGVLSPTADAYVVTPGEPFEARAASGLLANDGQGGVVVDADTTTAQGALVDVDPSGAFSYLAPDRMSVADTFSYRVGAGSGAPVDVTVTLTPRPGCGDGIDRPGELCFPTNLLALRGDVPDPDLIDMDGDGDLDLIVTSAGPSRETVTQVFETVPVGPMVALRRGAVVTRPNEAFVGAQAVADVDGDGDADILVPTTDGLILWRANGLGGYAAELVDVLDVGIPGWWSLDAGDVNGDGVQDVVVSGGNAAALYAGDGAGALGFAGTWLWAFGSDDLELIDLGDDGALDVVLTGYYMYPDYITALRGDGAGAFTSWHIDAGCEGQLFVVPRDLNGDGVSDLVMPCLTRGKVTNALMVVPGDGLGGYGAPMEITPAEVDHFSHALAVGDVTGDGRFDVVFDDPAASRLHVLAGGPGFDFTEATGGAVHLTLAPRTLFADDLDHDGQVEVVAVGIGGVDLLRSSASGELSLLSPPHTGDLIGADLTDVVMADVDEDGALDVVVADGVGEAIEVHFGDGAGAVGTSVLRIEVGAAIERVLVTDLNGDGHPDLLASLPVQEAVGVWLGDGSGAFTAAADVQAGPGAGPLAVGDFDEDGTVDLAVVNTETRRGSSVEGWSVSLFAGTGSGAFVPGPVPQLTGYYSPHAVAARDMNGDGHVDLLVVTFQDGGRSTVLLGRGDGSFFTAPGSPFEVGESARIALVDLDGDARPELVVSTGGSNGITVWAGGTAGRFTLRQTLPVGWTVRGLAVADFNVDGRPDVAVTTDQGAVVALGTTSGTLSLPADRFLRLEGTALAAGDLDGDGLPELVGVGGGRLTVITQTR